MPQKYDGIDRSSTEDQEIESSFQDSKFVNTRFNQIGEILTDEVVEAITTISRAPIPVQISNGAISTTPKYSRIRVTNTYDEDDEPNFTARPTQQRVVGISTTSKFLSARFSSVQPIL